MATSTPVPGATVPELTEEQRWSAWVARGAVHTRLVQRRLTVVALVLACVVIAASLIALGMR